MKKHEVYQKQVHSILRGVELLCEALTPYPQYWMEWIGRTPRFYREDGHTKRVLTPYDLSGLSREYVWGPNLDTPPGQPGSYIQKVGAGDVDRILKSRSGGEFRLRVIKPPENAPDTQKISLSYDEHAPRTPDDAARAFSSDGEEIPVNDHPEAGPYTEPKIDGMVANEEAKKILFGHSEADPYTEPRPMYEPKPITYTVPVASVPEIEAIVERKLQELGLINKPAERTEDVPKKVTREAIDTLIKRVDVRYDWGGKNYEDLNLEHDRISVKGFLDEHGIPHE